jgi:hypothetical protein
VPKSPSLGTTPEEMQRRAVMAQQLLENPLLQEAVGALEADLVAQLRAVSLADSEAHTRLVMAFQISSAVSRYLWGAINDGARAREQLQIRGSRID